MQIRYLPLVLVLIATGCQESNKTTLSQERSEAAATEMQSAQAKQPQNNKFWQKLDIREFRDNNGTVVVTMPFPSDWNIASAPAKGDPVITGPNGLKVTDYPAHSFMDNYNPSLQQTYYQSGQQLRSMPGIEQLIQEDFVPGFMKEGYEFVRYYEIPEISQIDKWYSDQLYKAMPSRSDVMAYGTEWKAADGSMYFMLIHLNASTSNTMQTWYYASSGLEAEADYYERAKKQYIFALSNARYNLEPIMAYNQQEAQRVGQSWAAHNQRMAQNQAAFEASQRAHVNRTNAINDAIMSGWRARNASSDATQERTIDGIYERTNAVDPTTGQSYKVAAGANQYWMNSNGEYIGTKLQDYNPNLDDNMNGQKWQQLKEVR